MEEGGRHAEDNTLYSRFIPCDLMITVQVGARWRGGSGHVAVHDERSA